jgi:hypothetical protein
VPVGSLWSFGTPGSGKLEYKECGGEPKRVDPELSLSLSLSPNSNINIILGDFINLVTFSKEVNIIYIKWVYCDIGM